MQRPFPAYDGDDPFIFVSYSHADSKRVYAELANLRESGFNVWYDEGISPGSRWTDDLADRISDAALVLVFVTPNSVSSENCRNEIDYALEQQRSLLLVHLVPTELPSGLRLAVSGRQAILKYEHSPAAYQEKLLHAAEELVEGHVTRVDPRGDPRRQARRQRLVLGFAAVMLLLVGSVGGYLLYDETPATAVAARSEPLPILIADFNNATDQPVFDGVLEEALKIGMEGAPFITSYPRSNAARVLEELTQESELTHDGARLVAVREGLQLVLAGTVRRDGGGYELEVVGIDPLSGEVMIEADEDAGSPLEALTAIAALAETLRRGLGDVTIETTHLEELFTSSSMLAISEFAKAQALAADWRHAEAVVHYENAVGHDENFGRAYGGWAYSTYSLGQMEKSKALWEKSLLLLNTMTERERLRTLGIYYMTVTGNIEKAIETYESMVEQFPADAAGHNNLAVAYFSNLQLEHARDVELRLLEIYPSSLMYLMNAALYNMYIADTAGAQEYADRVLQEDPGSFIPYLPLAINALLDADYQAAYGFYGEMAATGAAGTSLADLGRADIALARGNVAAAIEILRESIAVDEAQQFTANATTKRLWLARALLLKGQTKQAEAVLEELAELSLTDRNELELAEVHLLIGDVDAAIAAADRLAARLPGRSRAMAHIIRAQVALQAGKHQQAIDFLNNSLAIRDSWMVHYWLGRAYIELEDSIVEAMDEFETAWKRRGEAVVVFLDEVPSYERLADVQYWLGRSQQAIGMKDIAAENYRNFTLRRDLDGDAHMVKDANSRIEALTGPAR